MKSKKISCALLVTLSTFSVHAKMYKCTDNHGKVTYSGSRCQADHNQEKPVAVKGNTVVKVANDTGEVGLMPGLPMGPHSPDMKQPRQGRIGYGVDSNHPQLKGLVVGEKDFTGEGLQPTERRSTIASLYSVKFALDINMSTSGDSKSRSNLPLLVNAKVMGKKAVSNQEMVDRMMRAIQWLSQMHAFTVTISMPLPRGGMDYKVLCRAFEKEDIIFIAEVSDISRGAIGDPAMCKPKNMLVVGTAQ